MIENLIVLKRERERERGGEGGVGGNEVFFDSFYLSTRLRSIEYIMLIWLNAIYSYSSVR